MRLRKKHNNPSTSSIIPFKHIIWGGVIGEVHISFKISISNRLLQTIQESQEPVQILVEEEFQNRPENLINRGKASSEPTATSESKWFSRHHHREPRSKIQDHLTTGSGDYEMDRRCDSRDQELEMERLEAAKKEQQRINEINSAIRSLSTNLIISFVFLGFTFLWPLFNELFLVIALVLLKVLIPVIATASNFVIIHRLLLEQFKSCMKAATVGVSIEE